MSKLGDFAQHQEKIRQTLIVNNWSSKCGNCRRGANPNEKRHDTVLEMGEHNGEPGCHHYWRYISSDYFDTEDTVKKIRPDLQWLDQFNIFVDHTPEVLPSNKDLGGDTGTLPSESDNKETIQ